MAINLENLFQNRNVQNNNVSTTTQQVLRDAANAVAAKDGAALKDAVAQLRNLMVGDIFTGEVTSLQDGRVNIQLGVGREISASLQNQVTMNQGEKLMFMVQSNDDNQISLKVLDSNSQEMIMMNKALSAAGMAVNDTTMTMVKSLLDNNMPIDKNTLNEMSRQMLKFPEASADTLARLNKLGIPVTEGNITQFDAYRSYEHQITGTLNQAVEAFSGLMEKWSADGNSMEALKLFSGMTEILSEENSLIRDGVALDLAKQMAKEDMPVELQKLSVRLSNEPMTPGDLARELNNIFQNENVPREALSKLVSSQNFTKLFEDVLQKELLLTPEEAANKEEVKDFYSRLHEKTRALADMLQKGGEQTQNLAKSFAAVRDNVNFMNDLSQNMTFMQFPVKFPDGQTQGDLYVYTNKKSLREHPDNISALLHLDMEHLGPMDIYVKMAGKNVSTNFCLESEEMLDFIYEHIEELNKRIDKLGLHFQFTMNVKEDLEDSQKPVSFTEDFLDKSSPVISVKSYLFDSRA